MQKIFLIAIFVLCHPHSWANKPHSHSEAHVNLAFDGLKGAFELELPASALVDFEHHPKNPVQKLKLQKALESLKFSIEKILIIESSFGCKISSATSEVVYSGKKETHSEFKLTAQIQCLNIPTPKNFRISVLKAYPKLDQVEVQTLFGDGQNSFILKGTQDTLN